MNKYFYILPIVLLGAASCQSSSYRSYDERPTVADKTLMSVPASERADIDNARMERSKAVDEVGLAEREVERAKERVKIAKGDVDIAAAEYDAAQSRIELAQGSNASDRNDRIDASMKDLDGVRAHASWARTQVRLEEGRVEEAQAKVNVAEMRVELADARIELAKAQAVESLDRDDYRDIDVREFERRVADEELAVKMAEIEADACGKKLELRNDLLESRAKAVPASYRSSWKQNNKPSK